MLRTQILETFGSEAWRNPDDKDPRVVKVDQDLLPI